MAFEYLVRQMGKPGRISLFQKVFKGNKNSHPELGIWSNQKTSVKTEKRGKHSGCVYMFFPSFAGFNVTEVGNCQEDSHSSSLVFKILGAGGHQSVVKAVSHRDICRVLSGRTTQCSVGTPSAALQAQIPWQPLSLAPTIAQGSWDPGMEQGFCTLLRVFPLNGLLRCLIKAT